MKYLSQRDPAWSNVKMGNSNVTIGRFGCTITSCSMLSDYFSGYVSPPEIAGHNEVFTKEGYVIWSKLAFFPTMQFEDRLSGADMFVHVNQALRDPNQACILQVNGTAHWVVALGKSLFGNDYRILDPWTGKKGLARRDYHDITGCALFSRKLKK